MSPLVTVYITNYNYGLYIESAIQSVLNQVYKNIEVLIIDDGSTDNSREIIEKYRSVENIEIIYQKNKGLNATNNVALKIARGKYIMRLDADDYLELSAVAIMTAILEADPELGLVFPDYYYVDANGNVTGQERRHHFDDEVSLYDQPAHGACTLIRTEFLRNLGGYDESFTCQDGYELWIKFVSFHKVTNISRPLFSYRRHGNNLTTNEKRILDTRKAIKSSFVKKYFSSEKGIAIIPVRSMRIGGVNWPLTKIQGSSIVKNKVETCLESSSISNVVVTTSELELFEYFSLELAGLKNVHVILRPIEFSYQTVTLSETVKFILERMELQYDFVATIAIEFPFLESSTIEEAANTLVLFKADSVITVRPEFSTFYTHNGNSFKPILDQDKKTKYEREAIYKGVGGVVLSSKKNFLENGKMLGNRIAHIQLDNKNAFSVLSDFELDLFQQFVNGK